MGNITLSEVNEEKNLGVIFTHKNLKAVCNCGEVVKKASVILEVIKRIFQDKSVQTLLPLYKSLVRSTIEYYIQACRPYLKKDIEQLERVEKEQLDWLIVLDTCLMM